MGNTNSAETDQESMQAIATSMASVCEQNVDVSQDALCKFTLDKGCSGTTITCGNTAETTFSCTSSQAVNAVIAAAKSSSIVQQIPTFAALSANNSKQSQVTQQDVISNLEQSCVQNANITQNIDSSVVCTASNAVVDFTNRTDSVTACMLSQLQHIAEHDLQSARSKQTGDDLAIIIVAVVIGVLILLIIVFVRVIPDKRKAAAAKSATPGVVVNTAPTPPAIPAVVSGSS